MNVYRRPRVIFSKEDCKCDESGKMIIKGDKCLYDPVTKNVYCFDSDFCRNFVDNEVDEMNFRKAEWEFIKNKNK